MKKLVIVVAFFIFLEGYSQTWKYYSKENAFDGKFKMCYVTTKGVFPYSEPYLAIQSHEKNNEIDIFIADAGRYDLDEYVAVLWSFNNEPDVVYRTWELLFSKSGAIFNEQKFYTPPDYTDINKAKFLTKFEFINKIMSASSVSVRIKGKYNELLDLDFSLRGSSKAINYVIPNLSSLILEEKMIQDKQNLLKLEN